MTGSQLYIK